MIKVEIIPPVRPYFGNRFDDSFRHKYIHVVVPALRSRSNASILLSTRYSAEDADQIIRESNEKKKIQDIHETISLSVFPIDLFSGHRMEARIKEIYKAHVAHLRVPEILFLMDAGFLKEKQKAGLIEALEKVHAAFPWPQHMKKPFLLLGEESLKD